MRLLQDSGLVKVYVQEKHSQKVRESVASNTAFTITVCLPKLSKKRWVPADDSWQSEEQLEHDFYSNTVLLYKQNCLSKSDYFNGEQRPIRTGFL